MARNLAVYGLGVHVSLLILSIVCPEIATSASVLDINHGETEHRLRGMFEKSQAEAINNFYEQKALKMMMNPNEEHHNETNRIRFIPMSMLESHNKTGNDSIKDSQMSTKYLLVKELALSGRKGTNATDLESDKDDGQDSIKPNPADQHAKNDARQSSFFGGMQGIPPNGFGNTFGSANPIMGGFSNIRPPTFSSFSSFPTLSPYTTRPSRPPKTAIIGNNGGAMALTNDNVVVVNVLSGNY